MNKKYLFILIILMLYPLSTHAKFVKYISIGTTRATLRSEGGKSDWGQFVGLGLEYSPSSSLLFVIETAYATKKVTLENKSWPSSWYPPFSNVSIGDVPIDGSYFELCAKVGYSIPLINNQATIKLYIGPAFSVQLRYIGDFRLHTEFQLDPDEIGKYKFDYLRIDSEGSTNTSINPIIGAIISYKALGLEARYARSYTKRNYMLDLSINDKLDCFYFLLHYAF